MDPALRRRLDALVVLCSLLLGITITTLLVVAPVGPGALTASILPTGAILLVVYVYIERGEYAHQTDEGPTD
jgi:hypothetical protein